jgi:DNA-directed RNA polymerase subunit beta
METAELQYVEHRLEAPSRSVAECRARGLTYGAPLKVTFRLVQWETTGQGASATRSILDICEQELTLCEIPLPTSEQSFLIQGVERVLLRQLIEAPGVRFLPAATGGVKAQLQPLWGPKLSVEFDRKLRILVRLGWSKKRFTATLLLRALGLSTEEMVEKLCATETFLLQPGGKPSLRVDEDFLLGKRSPVDLRHKDEILLRRGRRFLRTTLRKLRELKIDRIPVPEEYLLHRLLARDVMDENTGEVLRSAVEPLRPEDLRRFGKAGVTSFSLIHADHIDTSSVISDMLQHELALTTEDALFTIWNASFPGDPPTAEAALLYLQNQLFNPRRLHLSLAGRRVLDTKLHGGPQGSEPAMTLTMPDLLALIRGLIQRHQRLQADDTGALEEAVVRDVPALFGDAFRFGLSRLERLVKERLSMVQSLSGMAPAEFINGRPVQKRIDEFFGWSRVSERADLLNPVAELSQRRRLSTLAGDRASLKRSSFRKRDHHESSLGVFCPVEKHPTGLALALGASVDLAGFLVPGCAPLAAISRGEAPPPPPWQLLGPAASLLPFVQHDDPDAAARGVENLRMSLPSLHGQTPLVATGMEAEVAHRSGLAVVAPARGRVLQADARVVVLDTEEGLESWDLRSFERAPRGVVRQRPVVRAGQRVEAGELLAAGLGVVSGEAAAGENLVVALVAGPTLGASLVLSEAVVGRGAFTSVRIREYRALLAPRGSYEEDFTRDVPELEEEQREGLDEQGVARVGRRVQGGDWLAGRVRRSIPWIDGEEPVVEDISLRLPAGHEGVVVGAFLESRRQATLPRKVPARARVLVAERCAIEVGDRLGSRHGDRGTIARIAPAEDMPLLPDGTPVDLLMDPGYILEHRAVGLLLELLAGAPNLPVIVPPFAEVSEPQLLARLGAASVALRDGRTGEPLEQPVPVGRLYLMKLPFLARDTFQARSSGPLDPLTGLPTERDGVAPGQLVDEDMTTALMAHGAAYTLQEMLSSKGDADAGREAIPAMIRGHEPPQDHVPQGLDALFRELQAAALVVQGVEPGEAPPASCREVPQGRSQDGKTTPRKGSRRRASGPS